MITKRKSPTDTLVDKFLQQVQKIHINTELIKVLKARVFKIANANVLIRAASSPVGLNGNYFFGINYITVEEMANLDNPFVAFICGDLNSVVIIPASILFNNLKFISHDRNGEYKILIDKSFNIALKGRNNRILCKDFINNWDILLTTQSNNKTEKESIEESYHSILQGRILEIGNVRGFQTYCPNKSKIFNGRKLAEIATLESCPDLQFSDYELLKQIDVLWFKDKGNHLIPECAFEVELSTGTWSGVGRMASLIDYSNVRLYVISDNSKKYNQVINVLPTLQNRYKYISTDIIGDLYSSELQLKELREKIGL